MPPADAATAPAAAAAPAKYVPPPKPEQPLSDVAALLNADKGPLFRNETVRFDFRTDSETKTRRPSLWLTLPVPTWDGVRAKLTSEDDAERSKFQNYILDLISEQVIAAAKAQVGDDEKPVNKQEELKIELIDWTYLVTQPPSVRRGNGIAKEVWEAWAKDYATTMPGLTNKSPERISNQLKLFMSKFAQCRTQKKVIAKLLEELEIYTGGSPQAEEFAPIIEFLVNKGTELQNMTEEGVLDNL